MTKYITHIIGGVLSMLIALSISLTLFYSPNVAAATENVSFGNRTYLQATNVFSHTIYLPIVISGETAKTPEKAIQNTIIEHSGNLGNEYIYQVQNIKVEDEWAYADLSLISQSSSQLVPSGGTIALAHKETDGSWSARLPVDGELFNDWLDQTPDYLINRLVKDMVRSSTPSLEAQNFIRNANHYLPWPAPHGAFVNQNYQTHGLGRIDFGIDVLDILATRDGTVVYANDSHHLSGGSDFMIYNNVIVISHTSQEYTLYLHLKKDSIPDWIKSGCPNGIMSCSVPIKRGDKIGEMGNVGWSTGPHLHLSTASNFYISINEDFKDEDKDGNYSEPVYTAFTNSYIAVDFVEYTYNQLYSQPGNEKIYSQNGDNQCSQTTSSIMLANCETPTPTPPPSGEQVKLFRAANYHDEAYRVSYGFSNAPNAEIYSMEIPNNVWVKTWRGDNRNGESRCWSESVANLQDHGWHLAIQSIEVFSFDVCSTSTGKVKLYSLANYQDEIFNGGPGVSNEPSANSFSMHIPADWSVYTYRDDNLDGERRCWSESVANLQDHGWHLAIQSIEVFDTNECRIPGAGVRICRDKGYKNCMSIDLDAASLGNFGFGNDELESIEILGDGEVVLFADDNFKGTHSVIRGSDSDLSNNAIGNNQASSIRIRRRNPALFTLHERGDFNGEAFYSDRTITDLDHWNKNDWAKSITVLSGYEVIACTHSDFHGVCGRTKQSAGDINSVAYGLREAVSSVRVCEGQCPPTPDIPNHVYPANGSTLPSDNPISFLWSGNGDKYRIKIEGGDLGQPIISGWSDSFQWTIDTLPASPNPYSWVLQAWNEYGETGWSSPQYFNVGVSKVRLLSLANYEGDVLFTGDVGFSNAPNAASFSLQIPDNQSVRTWREDNRGGESRCWTESVPNLQDHGWHLSIQSLEIYAASSCPDVTPTPTPTITPPSNPEEVELLSQPWYLVGNNGASEKYQEIDPNVLADKDCLRITYNLHGLSPLGNDASAIIIDQGGWHYISLSEYGQPGLDGIQTVEIPLSDFPGLDLTQPVGTLHTRFWYDSQFNVDITSIIACKSQNGTPTPTPTNTPTSTNTPQPTVTPTSTATQTPTATPIGNPEGIELLTTLWHLAGNNGASEKYQGIDPNVLADKDMLKITYDLHGLNALGGDASAIIIDQNGWHFISLSNYGQNGLDGVQTVDVPLSDFPGLDLTQPVGTLHTRFWYDSQFTVDITSIIAYSTQ